MIGIDGYKVLVTASTTGIGRGIAEVLLEEGASVVINGHNSERLERAVSNLKSKYGEDRVHGVLADITVEEDVAKLVNAAVNLLGGLDAVVYNTGPPKPGKFLDLSIDDWVYASRLLIFSALWVAYYSIPHLSKSPHPSIVFITSSATKEPIGTIALSSTLRVAVHGLVKILSKELGPMGIRVNAIMPGYIETSRFYQLVERRVSREKKNREEVIEDIKNSIPLRRIGSPIEIGKVVAFLLSPYASYVSGASIPVDGGRASSIF